MPERELSKDQLACLLVSLSAARDSTLVAAVALDLKFSHQSEHVLKALQRVANDAGLELVERHQQPDTDRLADQMSGKTTATDLVSQRDFPKGVVNR